MATTPQELAAHLDTVASKSNIHPKIEKGLLDIIAQLRDGEDADGKPINYAAVRKSALDLAGTAKIYGEGMIRRELQTAAKIIQVFEFTQ